jgi:protein-S-isoprenylcysteine O-methyltransferase Ste14
MNKYLSILFPLSLIALIILITCYRWSQYTIIQLILIHAYILWILYELIISKKDFIENNSRADGSTREIYALTHGLTIFSALYFNTDCNFTANQIIGSSLFIAGITLRIWSIRTLGKCYSHNVRLLEKHPVIKNWPYSYIRHPAYSGMILIHTGTTILFFNYITLIIFFTILVPAIIIRIHTEEIILNKLPGYRKYFYHKKRIIPLIW